MYHVLQHVLQNIKNNATRLRSQLMACEQEVRALGDTPTKANCQRLQDLKRRVDEISRESEQEIDYWQFVKKEMNLC